MAAIKAFATRQRLTLIGDAFLMTAAAFSVVIGVSAILIAPDGSPSSGTEWLAALSSLLSLAVIVAVPILVWLLHGRRLSLMAVLGGVLGAASTGVVFFAVVALSALLGFVVSPFWGAEYAGPLIALILIALAAVATVIWLVVLAIRDLTGDREHPWIDGLRLASTAVLIAYGAGVAMWISAQPNDDSIDALVFALVAGIAAALAVLGAEIMTAVGSARRDSPAPPLTTPRR